MKKPLGPPFPPMRSMEEKKLRFGKPSPHGPIKTARRMKERLVSDLCKSEYRYSQACSTRLRLSITKSEKKLSIVSYIHNPPYEETQLTSIYCLEKVSYITAIQINKANLS